MNLTVLFLILLAVFMSAFGQVALKLGITHPDMQLAIAAAIPSRLLIVLLTSPWLLCGLLVYVLSVAVWLVVLSKVDVSYAYPFVALGMVITTLSGRFVLGESLPAMRLLGLAVIVVGVVVVAVSYPRPRPTPESTSAGSVDPTGILDRAK